MKRTVSLLVISSLSICSCKENSKKSVIKLKKNAYNFLYINNLMNWCEF